MMQDPLSVGLLGTEGQSKASEAQLKIDRIGKDREWDKTTTVT